MNVARVAQLLRELADEIEAEDVRVQACPPPPCPECEERAFDSLDGAFHAREILARFELDWRAPREPSVAAKNRRSLAREGVQAVDAFVYFIGVRGGGPIKIGFTTNLPARCAALFPGSPVELELLATEPGGLEVEQALHEKFAAHRMHGEWFRPGEDLLAYVDAAKRPT